MQHQLATHAATAKQLDQLTDADWDKLIDGLCIDLSKVFSAKRTKAKVIEMPVRAA